MRRQASEPWERTLETRDIVFIALFAAIMAGLAVFPPIMLPVVGVPITAQSIGAMLAGGVLGAARGGLSMALFLALVAFGLPLLPGGRGGFGVFFGPTAAASSSAGSSPPSWSDFLSNGCGVD